MLSYFLNSFNISFGHKASKACFKHLNENNRDISSFGKLLFKSGLIFAVETLNHANSHYGSVPFVSFSSSCSRSPYLPYSPFLFLINLVLW